MLIPPSQKFLETVSIQRSFSRNSNDNGPVSRSELHDATTPQITSGELQPFLISLISLIPHPVSDVILSDPVRG